MHVYAYQILLILSVWKELQAKWSRVMCSEVN